MGKLIRRIRDWFEDVLRQICGRINPDRRVAVIVVLITVFAVVNIWVTFRAIYSIGREEKRLDHIELIEFPDLRIRDNITDAEDTEDELRTEDTENIDEQFNTEIYDTTESE